MNVFGSKTATSIGIKDAVKSVSDMGVDEDVRNSAREHMRRALASLQEYGDVPARHSLELAADFIVGRSL